LLLHDLLSSLSLFLSAASHRTLLSFPTRRSSDLESSRTRSRRPALARPSRTTSQCQPSNAPLGILFLDRRISSTCFTARLAPLEKCGGPPRSHRSPRNQISA